MKGTTKIYQMAEAIVGVPTEDIEIPSKAVVAERAIRQLRLSREFLVNVKKPKFLYNKQYELFYQDEDC